MEDNGNEIGRPREIVTLILNNERFETDRQKLIDKSLYFAALLSSNYLECGQTEHVVNYEIPSRLFQDFIYWIHKDNISFVSDYEINYDLETLDRLLDLLELSVLFTADILISDITDQIEKYFMLPKYVINICSVAQELSTNVLRDLSWAFCLDRFDELPFDSVLELTPESFLKLIGNINIRTTKSYVRGVGDEWMKYHNDFEISNTLDTLDTLRNEKPIILPSIISCEYNNNKQFIHSWDGNDFFELTSFEYPIDIIEHCRSYGKNIEGMQITARRYDIYLCGGEYGIGSGRFNKNIWRYSLISKKWSFVTVMPAQRRHMIAVFFENKLVLVGGVGQNQQKLQTIEIYDIHTDTWRTSRTEMSLQFTSVPDYIIYNDQLIIHQYLPIFYIYHFEVDVWEKRTLLNMEYNNISSHVPIVTPCEPMSCYIDIDQDRMILRTITDTCNMEDCNQRLIISENSYYLVNIKNEPKTKYFDKISWTKCNENRFFIIPCYRNKQYNNPAVLLCIDIERLENIHNLHLHSIPIRNPAKFHTLVFQGNTFSTSKFFNLFHPAHLYTTYLDLIWPE